MKRLGKYLLAFGGTMVLALSLANAVASACDYLIIDDNITCYRTGQDSQWCYYDCYCKTTAAACEESYNANGLLNVY